jgi:hypothetical protein
MSFILISLGVLGITTFAAELPVLSGYVRNYTGVIASENPAFAILQNTVNLTLDYRKDKVGLKINPWLYHYPKTELEIGLREAYLDIFLNSLDIRIGKQQIMWGKGEGVFITDIISPKDMREFLLPDFEEIRIGVNALKMNLFRGKHNFELVLLPQFVPTILPDEGSIWRPKISFPLRPTIDSTKMDVPLLVENGEVFGKYSLMTSVADIDVLGGYTWDDDPTMHIRKTMNPQTQTLAAIEITPRHHRLIVAGTAFSTVVGDFVIRSEGAWYRGKYFSTLDMSDADGVVEKDYINYLVGTDFNLWEIKFSTQYIQKAILDYSKDISEPQFENMVTFLARRDFLRETLTLDFFAYIGIDESDALLKPRVQYAFADGFELQLGANIFVGDSGRFGIYDKNDMLYLKAKFAF